MLWLLTLCFSPFAIRSCFSCMQSKNKLSFILAIWFIISLILEPFAASTIIYNLRYVSHIDPMTRIPYDFFHMILPYVPGMYWYYCTFMLCIVLPIIIFVIYHDQDKRDNILFTVATLLLIRNFTISLTNIPLSYFDIDDGRCISYSKLPYFQILKHTLLGFECADYFFSGHMIFYTLGLICAQNLSQNLSQNIYYQTSIIIIYISCVFAILMSQAHYSIDVLFGILSTLAMYYFISPSIINKLSSRL
jgi:hypothetical protein